jgi:hypothetical protein
MLLAIFLGTFSHIGMIAFTSITIIFYGYETSDRAKNT